MSKQKNSLRETRAFFAPPAPPGRRQLSSSSAAVPSTSESALELGTELLEVDEESLDPSSEDEPSSDGESLISQDAAHAASLSS
jgi:hypothetical protein